jgi:hypothetical protein
METDLNKLILKSKAGWVQYVFNCQTIIADSIDIDIETNR